MFRLYGKFTSYLRCVLCKTRLIFPRINGPIVTFHQLLSKFNSGHATSRLIVSISELEIFLRWYDPFFLDVCSGVWGSNNNWDENLTLVNTHRFFHLVHFLSFVDNRHQGTGIFCLEIIDFAWLYRLSRLITSSLTLTLYIAMFVSGETYEGTRTLCWPYQRFSGWIDFYLELSTKRPWSCPIFR